MTLSKQTLIFAALTCWLPTAGYAQQADDFPHEAKFIPIQHNGQVKSLESFARQTLNLVCEKDHWQGKSATQTVLEATGDPEKAKTMRWIKVQLPALRETLGLDKNRTFFSYEELAPVADAMLSLVRSSQQKRDQDIRPTMVEQKAESVYSKMMEVRRLLDRESLLVAPPPDGHSWIPVSESAFGKPFLKLLDLVREKNTAELREAVMTWKQFAETATKGAFARKIRLEILYYDLRPFHLAGFLYLLAFVCISLLPKRKFAASGTVLAVAALAFHTTGLALRVAILGRPPVSNMYESIVYMNWALMVVASISGALRRQSMPLSMGALLSAVVMLYADLLPMDSSLEVLVPVLRSNYWLTIHVMTIVSSYGVLGLAMGLSHRHLILQFRKKLNKKEGADSAKLIYRTIQIGAILLGIGTTLGGVWANESWGRFWGWDPKETWALITFLGYLVIIHLYHFGHLKPFQLAVAGVVAFQLVIMTWYGVNFVLGRGLHSYGQGSGGAIWIIYYLVAESLFLAFIFWKKYGAPKAGH